MALIEGIVAGDPRAAGRAMTMVEDGEAGAQDLLRGIAARTGRAQVTGFTGPPGVGKSSLVAALTIAVRATGRTVGIVAADPTSAFTGGALLGDRVRMRALFEDPHVFIRSMATREHPGCLPPAARDVCRVLDAMGKDLIFLETVGAGQSDVRVVRYVDTVVLVLSPGTGDYIQAMKAGSMEIADVVAVNKADLPGAEQAVTDLTTFLESRRGGSRLAPGRGGDPSETGPGWQIPVVATSTIKDGRGLDALLDAIEAHARHLVETGELESRRRQSLRQEIADYCVEHVAGRVLARDRLDGYVVQVVEGRLTTAEAGRRLARDLPSEAAPATGQDDGA